MDAPYRPGIMVTSIDELVETKFKFPTICADAPWQYENSASRASACSHYKTMNTYTDSRLLDTSAAVESLPSLPLKSFVAPTVAPDFGKSCPKEAIDVTFGDPTDDFEKRKNPANTQVIAGFSSIGPAGFEPTTSTTPR